MSASSPKRRKGANGVIREKLSIVGIGRLGLCFALTLEDAGYDVVGVDLNEPYVKKINDKTLSSKEPRVEELLAKATHLRATSSLEEGLAHSDLIFILVDTPSSGNETHYDHSKLGSVLMAINKLKVKGKHLIIGCTVMPGYIAKVGRYLIQDCVDTTLSYNPEFIAQGDIIKGQQKPDMVLIGEGSKEAGDQMQAVYEKLCQNKPEIARMSPESAEICKLSVNCFVTMKIAYANTIGDIADATPGANKDEILNAVGADSRVGKKYLRPGYGYGGPCFPRDNRAMAGYGRQVGISTEMFHATDNCNAAHTKNQLKRKLEQGKDSYTFAGVAYKEGTQVPIVEESQRLFVARGLAEAGKKVTLRDYPGIIAECKKLYGGLFDYETYADSK
jgi:nucleotide sugar dehydrogenase